MFYDQTPVNESTAADLDDDAADEMLAAIGERGHELAIAGLPQLVREHTGRAPALHLAGDEFVVTLPRTADEPG